MRASLSGVQVLRPAQGPLNLILVGREAGTPSTCTEIAFSHVAGDVPDDAEYAEITECEALPGEPPRRSWEVVTARGTYVLHARSAHLHRDVATALVTLLPPVRVPRLRRLGWRWLPSLVGSAFGRRLLKFARG